MLLAPFKSLFVGSFFRPVALQRSHHFKVGIGGYGVDKAFVPFDGRRRTFESHHFDYLTVSLQTCRNVLSHLASHLVVVGTHKSGIFLRVGFALKDDDWYAAIVGAVNGGRDGCHLVGGYDKQLDAAVQKAVNLFYLSLVTVISCCKAQFYALIEEGAHAQFGILLVAPDVFGTLGNTDDVMLL